MKRAFKVLKAMLAIIAGIAGVLAVATFAFVNMSPEFGESTDEADEQIFSRLSNYSDGKFQNTLPTTLGLSFGETLSVAREFFFGSKAEKNPDGPLPMVRLDSTNLARTYDGVRATWFGHSAVLLEAGGKKILFDPMLGQHAGPLPLISPRRYNPELPIEVEKLPAIDVVVISHDHYDHLDYGSIIGLRDKVDKFFVPLGVGAHLRSWGVAKEKIVELNWGEAGTHGGTRFICAPARHFSGRGFKSNTTLWCSWIVQTGAHQIYFSGDSGYGPHFKEIGEKYGAMDLVMMECGQYDERWAAIHMMPEETVQAAIDVKSKLLLPIHWGAFTLAMHPWQDPVVRASEEAKRLNVNITTPRIGEAFFLSGDAVPLQRWW